MLFSHISRESYVCNLYEIIGEVCLCACVCTWWPHSAVKSLNPPDMPEMLSKHFNGGGKQYLHGDAVKMNSRPTVKSGGVSITHAN